VDDYDKSATQKQRIEQINSLFELKNQGKICGFHRSLKNKKALFPGLFHECFVRKC